MANLTGMSEDVKGMTIEVGDEPVEIGRTKENTVVLDNPTVSSRHCSISRDGNRYVLRDLGSTNGTRVNARDIQETSLRPKDIVQVGSVEFLFDADDVEVVDTSNLSDTKVEEEKGPTGVPQSFDNISPFGAKKESKSFWFVLIAILFIVALAVVVLFFFRLVTTT